MSSQQFRTNNKKQPYPLRDSSSGVTEDSFREGDKNILGTPQREYSRATPNSELAHLKTQDNYLKSLHKRFKEARAGGRARKTEKKEEKAERKKASAEELKQADLNLRRANAFLARSEAIQKGRNPPPVDVNLEVIEEKKTIPKHVTTDEQLAEIKKKVDETKKENKLIKDLNAPAPEPPKPEPPSSPAMAKPVGNGHAQTSPQTEESYAYAAAPAFTTQGKNPEKPKDKKDSDLSLSEQALVRFPAKG